MIPEVERNIPDKLKRASARGLNTLLNANLFSDSLIKLIFNLDF